MELINLIKQKKDDLSSSEKKVAEIILKHPEYVENETISRIAQYADTSTSAVLRFCQSLGYNGFKDFKFAFIHNAKTAEGSNNDTDLMIQSIADNVLMLKRFPKASIAQLAEDIIHGSSIYVYGLHYSALAARNLIMRLEDLGIRAYGGFDTVSGTHTANTIDSSSVLICFSVMGDDRSYRNILDSLPTKHKHFYLITSNNHNKVSRYYDHVCVLPILDHLQGAVNEHMAQMVFIELLIQNIRKKTI